MKALKGFVKEGLGVLALSPICSSWTRRRLRDGINVVYMHYVGEAVPYYADLYAGSTVERLDHDLTVLKRHFEFAPLVDVVRQRSGAGAPSRPLLALTFDDGFDALRNDLIDVLAHHRIRATSFVITDMVGNTNLMWRNKLMAIRALRDEPLYVQHYNALMTKVARPGISRGKELLPASAGWPMAIKEELVDALWKACDMPMLSEFLDEHRPYFTWDGLKRWLAAGHDVGLHTATHPYCSRLSTEGIRAEIEEPAALLRTRLGLDFIAFSYPFGVRLAEAAERRLYADKVFDYAFGIEGFAPRGTPDYRLGRECIEKTIAFPVFGTALMGKTLRSLRGSSAHY